jgi:hypothetical protein
VPGLARRIRECLGDDPTGLILSLVDIANGVVVNGETPKVNERIAAIRELMDRGYGKAPAFAPMEVKDDPLERDELDKAIQQIADELAARRAHPDLDAYVVREPAGELGTG